MYERHFQTQLPKVQLPNPCLGIWIEDAWSAKVLSVSGLHCPGGYVWTAAVWKSDGVYLGDRHQLYTSLCMSLDTLLPVQVSRAFISVIKGLHRGPLVEAVSPTAHLTEGVFMRQGGTEQCWTVFYHFILLGGDRCIICYRVMQVITESHR